ncbi:MAG: AMP-binding protein, partial [Actinomycetota bacterium]
MSDAIESLLQEGRTFPPPDGFVAGAQVRDRAVFAEAEADPEAFWARQAEELLTWFEPWHTVCDWDLPFAKWFVGGSLNASYNCIDRHVEAGAGDTVAYHWEGEPGDTRTITYADLLREVSRLANALKALGVRKGDRVCIYLGMVPELPMALLACARIGAAHSVVFGGFSADSLRDRVNDAGAKVLVTGDGAWRRGTVVPLKQTVDEALTECPGIEHVLVLERTAHGVPMTEGRDVWWHDLVPQQSEECPPEPMDSEDLLYLLYTSGTTAKPKGIM